MKKILVPVDFSKDSINALEHAITLANKMNAAVRMIHVKKSENFEPTFMEESESIKLDTVKGYFNILYDRYHQQLTSQKLDFKIREGQIYREITNQAKYDDTYMIIMGTHGVSGFQDFWIGSNAFRVVSNAPCPVITIRYGFEKKKLEKLVLPIDISHVSRLKVPLVAELAEMMDLEIYVVAVQETNLPDVTSKINQYGKQAYEYFQSKGLKCYLEPITGENITEFTIEYAKKIDAELIAIMTSQTENVNNIWLGSYAQQMVNRSPIPVMSIRPNVVNHE